MPMLELTDDRRSARGAIPREDLRDAVVVKNAVKSAVADLEPADRERINFTLDARNLGGTLANLRKLAADPKLDAADFARALPEGPNQRAAGAALEKFVDGVLGAKTTADLAGPSAALADAIRLAGAPAVAAFLQRGIPPRELQAPAPADIPTAKKPIIRETSGQKGDWNEGLLDYRPPPNSILEVDGRYTYETDRLGRIVRATGELHLQTHARNSGQQASSGREDRLKTDVGGHLIGSQFDGPGEGFNIVPMDGRLNGNSKTDGAWGQMETRWAEALREGKKVKVDIRPVYPDDHRDDDIERRPDAFRVVYQIPPGPITSVTMKNMPGGK